TPDPHHVKLALLQLSKPPIFRIGWLERLIVGAWRHTSAGACAASRTSDSSRAGAALRETSSSTASSTWPSAVPPFPAPLSGPSMRHLLCPYPASLRCGPPAICRRLHLG